MDLVVGRRKLFSLVYHSNVSLAADSLPNIQNQTQPMRFPPSMRLIDESAKLLMSPVHLDYVRRNLAPDRGSDRFTTLNEPGCDAKA